MQKEVLYCLILIRQSDIMRAETENKQKRSPNKGEARLMLWRNQKRRLEDNETISEGRLRQERRGRTNTVAGIAQVQ